FRPDQFTHDTVNPLGFNTEDLAVHMVVAAPVDEEIDSRYPTLRASKTLAPAPTGLSPEAPQRCESLSVPTAPRRVSSNGRLQHRLPSDGGNNMDVGQLIPPNLLTANELDFAVKLEDEPQQLLLQQPAAPQMPMQFNLFDATPMGLAMSLDLQPQAPPRTVSQQPISQTNQRTNMLSMMDLFENEDDNDSFLSPTLIGSNGLHRVDSAASSASIHSASSVPSSRSAPALHHIRRGSCSSISSSHLTAFSDLRLDTAFAARGTCNSNTAPNSPARSYSHRSISSASSPRFTPLALSLPLFITTTDDGSPASLPPHPATAPSGARLTRSRSDGAAIRKRLTRRNTAVGAASLGLRSHGTPPPPLPEPTSPPPPPPTSPSPSVASSSERPRPFACATCSQTFYAQQDMERHATLHMATEDLPFACGCGMKFNRRDKCQRHVMAATCKNPSMPPPKKRGPKKGKE
ncbi:hypothetical protein HK101_009672, partial [Irineochytrium annulatum]